MPGPERRRGAGAGRGVRAAATAAIALTLAAAMWLLAARGVEVPAFESVRTAYHPSTAYLVDRHGEVLAALRRDFGVRRLQWVPLDAVSPAMIHALLAGEDARFYRHHGVDWRGVLGALRSQLLSDRQRGASTLSMQLATLLEAPRRGGNAWQSLWRKWRQVRVAVALEAHWSKRQILEGYLNLVSFRGEIQGIGAAAQVLAGKSPSGLDAAESEVLAALLPEPGATSPRLAARACARAQHSGVVSCEAVRAVVARLGNHDASAAAQEPLAPQLAAMLLTTPGERVQTTLDARLQRLARDALRVQLANLEDHNVRDGAVLVVDNASGEVLAYVGSSGSLSRAAAVDGVRARRQAGSTLKPFLYELAIERRYLTAASLLEDAPLNLDTGTGLYLPQDYDHDFKGLVSVRTALASSLNVPAVRTLLLTGVEPFRNRLQQLGYEGITEDGNYYGYSLALGSAEVSLWEQAQAYRVLARGGRFSPLRLRLDAPRTAERMLLPADAAFIVTDVLSDRSGRTLTFGLDNHLNTPFWSAAKTGTSKDMRDNWCVGFTRDYTVAVWVGNFEGDSMHEVSGVSGAAPVWHEVLSALPRDRAPPPPPTVVAAEVRFTPAVETPRREWFLAGTQMSQVRALAPAARVARLVSPANGMIIAVDPDIPLHAQRVPVKAQGVSAGMKISYNDSILGPASAALYFTPVRGSHRFALLDARGQVLDRIRVTVR